MLIYHRMVGALCVCVQLLRFQKIRENPQEVSILTKETLVDCGGCFL